MNRLELATLVEWAGEIKTRKRLQKVVYMLQAAGCSLRAEYTLHHYGPYSFDVAALTDEMVGAELLDEKKIQSGTGRSFSYKLTKHAKSQLSTIQQIPDGLFQHKRLAIRLLNDQDLSKLELGATVTYFHKQGESWDDAVIAAARFKKKKPDSTIMIEAGQFARKVVEPAGGK